MGSDLWVRMSLTDSTDVTLADEDTNSTLNDNVNRAIQGNVAMQVMQPGDTGLQEGLQVDYIIRGRVTAAAGGRLTIVQPILCHSRESRDPNHQPARLQLMHSSERRGATYFQFKICCCKFIQRWHKNVLLQVLQGEPSQIRNRQVDQEGNQTRSSEMSSACLSRKKPQCLFNFVPEESHNQAG